MISAAQSRAILTQEAAALKAVVPPWRAVRLWMAQSLTEGEWGDFGGYDASGTYYKNNWGGVQSPFSPPCPAGTFEREDSRPTASGQKKFAWCFQGYATLEAGARDFLRHAIVLRPKAYEAALSGDPRWYAEELRRTNYYHGFSATTGEGPEAEARRLEEQIAGYEKMLKTNAALVDAWLGLPPPQIGPRPLPSTPVQKPGRRARGALPFALAVGAAALVAINR